MGKKVRDGIAMVIALLLACLAFAWFDMEGILWRFTSVPVMDRKELEEHKGEVHTGKIAGEDVPKVKSMEEWEAAYNDVGYIVVTPKSVVETKVYAMGSWGDYYTKSRRGTAKRRKPQVKTGVDVDFDYAPYYVIELEDGSHILAQMHRSIARQIKKGKEVTLPLGQKTGMSQAARNALQEYCEEYHAPDDYVLDTNNAEWQEKYSDFSLIGKIAVAVVVFIAGGAVLLLLAEKLFPVEGDDE